MLGYSDLYRFVTGRLLGNTTVRSWNGVDNTTYQEIIKALFKADYDNIQIMPDEVKMEDKFILPYGFCKNINTQPFGKNWWMKIIFKNTKKYQLFVTNLKETTHNTISVR